MLGCISSGSFAESFRNSLSERNRSAFFFQSSISSDSASTPFLSSVKASLSPSRRETMTGMPHDAASIGVMPNPPHRRGCGCSAEQNIASIHKDISRAITHIAQQLHALEGFGFFDSATDIVSIRSVSGDHVDGFSGSRGGHCE